MLSPIFRSDDDRSHFLGLLQRTGGRQQWAVHAYALTTNHFHLVLRIEDGRLAYTEALGLRRLRARIARHYGEAHGIEVPLERVAVTTGSSAGFILAFLAAFDPGEHQAAVAVVESEGGAVGWVGRSSDVMATIP